MKYIQRFDTHSQYETFTGTTDFIKPNASYCVQENEVHYNPYDPYNGHEYVEIGGLKWATMNVGANSETDGGLYFQWGDTQGYAASQVGSGEGQKYFGWEDYKYGQYDAEASPDYGMTKYNSVDGKTILDASDDAATAAWGGNWRIPTNEDIQVLVNAANKRWTTNYNGSGVKGYVLTDKIDTTKVLFLPVTGEADEGITRYNNSGYYWTANYSFNGIFAYLFWFNDEAFSRGNSNYRSYGFSIRPVAD